VQALLYFFWISLTVTGCLVLSLRRASVYKFPLELYFSVTGWILITVPIGARLMHVLYEEPAYYAESPLRVFEIWRGGFVYYGGLLFSLLFFVFYFLKPRARSFWQTADFFAPVMSLGTGAGRIACFFQGCCYGRELHAFWAVRGLHPTQLYIFAWEMILFLSLLKLEKKRHTPGSLFLFWLAMSAFGRFIVEFYRDDFRGQMILGLSISQVLSLALIFISGCLYIFRKR
jgi:phosphatidylglycerol:prolipoprotein diacylglycerol transferase